MGKKELILTGSKLVGIKNTAELKEEYESWCQEVRFLAKKEGSTEEEQRELRVKMHYTENEYSEEAVRNSIGKAIKETISYLEESSKGSFPEKELTCETAVAVIERVLTHFYEYYRAMYRNPVHKKGTLRQETLNSIQIGNEYDLQRMLYALLLPVFPEIRLEVSEDNGYGTMRTDISLETYGLVIETKCTRERMSEKKLMEEMGADGFLYQSDIIFIFIYDKNDIIKNKSAFQQAFEREQNKGGKTVKTFILQPVEL